MKKILMWLVWHVNLGKLTPYILGLALGKMPQKNKRWRINE